MNITKWIVCLGACALALQLHAAPMGSAFTHQGRLDAGGFPATGAYDMQFSLYGGASGGTPLVASLTVPSVAVDRGVFTVHLDFGSAAFDGQRRWLEMGVRPAGGGASYTVLSPRQELTPTPYALYAETASWAYNAGFASTANSVTANAVGTAGLANGAVTSAKIVDGTIVAADLSPSLLGRAGNYSFAAGRRARADHTGAFVWADSIDADFPSTAANQFLVRAGGGVGINTNRPQQALHVNGGFALIEGNAHEQAYIGGDGFTSDVQIGSLNPAIVRVTLYNPATDGLMDLVGWVVDAAGAMRTPLVEVSQRIRVPGAGVGTTGPAFIHRATAANTAGHITTLSHPLCNGSPNAILMVTANYNPGGTGGVYNNHALGVYYTGSHWTIFNQDLVAMPVNAAFNVLVINP